MTQLELGSHTAPAKEPDCANCPLIDSPFCIIGGVTLYKDGTPVGDRSLPPPEVLMENGAQGRFRHYFGSPIIARHIVASGASNARQIPRSDVLAGLATRNLVRTVGEAYLKRMPTANSSFW